MSDWKQRIEQKRNEELRKAREEDLKGRINEKARREKERRREEEKLKAEYAKRLAKLQARFRCHICGKPSSKPSEKQESTGRLVQHHEFYSGPKEYEKITVEDWSSPGDLIKCDNCKKWTCAEHIHWGICKKCAERL